MGTFLSTSAPTSITSTKGKTKSGGTRKFKPSSGLLKKRIKARTMNMLMKKIARWERYKAEGKKSGTKRHGNNKLRPQRIGGRIANRNSWNVAGLQKQLAAVSK